MGPHTPSSFPPLALPRPAPRYLHLLPHLDEDDDGGGCLPGWAITQPSDLLHTFMLCQLWPCFWPRAFVGDASLYLYSVLGWGTVWALPPHHCAGRRQSGVPLFLWGVLQARRAPPPANGAQDQGARQNQLHRGCK